MVSHRNLIPLVSFSYQRWWMVFHKRLSDNESLQVFGTLLSIPAEFNSALVWIVSILPLISCFLSFFPNLWGQFHHTNYNCYLHVPVCLGFFQLFDTVKEFVDFFHFLLFSYWGLVFKPDLCNLILSQNSKEFFMRLILEDRFWFIHIAFGSCYYYYYYY